MATRKTLTAKQVAELLGFHEKTIRRAILSGGIKATKLHPKGPWLIPRSEVARFLGS